MTAKLPEERFASAAEFATALQVLPESKLTRWSTREPSHPPATFSLASKLEPLSLVEVSVPVALEDARMASTLAAAIEVEERGESSPTQPRRGRGAFSSAFILAGVVALLGVALWFVLA